MALVAMVFAAGCKKDPDNNGGNNGGGNNTATTGTLNGHDWVDLGLPSGILWATCNIGASSPEINGDKFAWGETTTKENFDWSTYKYYDYNADTLTKYTGNDNRVTLEMSDDVASSKWGSQWRIPTKDELTELKEKCTVKWIEQNGVFGRLYTGPNGNSIFLPAVNSRGHYWSSSLNTDDPNEVWCLYFYALDYITTDERCLDFFVRPVFSKN